MQKVKLLFLSFSVSILSLYGEAQNLPVTIKVQAMDMATAWMKNDFNTFMKYMHPDIIAYSGGKEKIKANMDSAYVGMKRFGARVTRYWIGSPGEIVHYKNQLQAVLPQSTTLAIFRGEIIAETSLIVISNDNGKNWWFIDTNLYDADKLKSIPVDLSPKLVIPPRKKPKLAPVKNG